MIRHFRSAAAGLTLAALVVVGTLAFAAPAAAADVDTTPVRVISGPSTGIGTVYGVAVASDGTTYIDDESPDEIDVFAPGATGDAAPENVISGVNTQLNEDGSIVLDAHNNIWVGQFTGSILEFAADATGNAAPIRVIAGSNTGFHGPGGITLGPDGTIYVADFAAAAVDVFDAAASGNVAPLRVISGSNTTFQNPYGVQVAADGSIVVSDFAAFTISTFGPTADGNVAPIRQIAGSNTQLNSDYYVALDSSGNIYASNFGSTSVTQYAADATGNVAPISRIVGPDTSLDAPYPITVAPDGDLYVGDYSGSSVSIFDPVFAVSGVTPASGSVDGGTTVTVDGFGFASGATVSFGGVAATDVQVTSPTTLTAVSPAHAVGAVDVTVTQGTISTTFPAGFRFALVLATTGVEVTPGLAAALALVILGLLLWVLAGLLRRRPAVP